MFHVEHWAFNVSFVGRMEVQNGTQAAGVFHRRQQFQKGCIKKVNLRQTFGLQLLVHCLPAAFEAVSTGWASSPQRDSLHETGLDH
jgi:hypothetical protein